MSRVIFKYPLSQGTLEDTVIRLPHKSTILSAGWQFPRMVVVWVEQNQPAEKEKLVPHLIREFWTGEALTVRTRGNILRFIGTVQDPQNGIVTHIFEEISA